jgi:hypothetical protein
MTSPTVRWLVAVVSGIATVLSAIVLTGLVDQEGLLKVAIGATLLSLVYAQTVMSALAQEKEEDDIPPLLDVSPATRARVRRSLRWFVLCYAVGLAVWVVQREQAAAPRRLEEFHALGVASAIIGMPIAAAVCAFAILGMSAIRTPVDQRDYPLLYRIRMWLLRRKWVSSGRSSADDSDDSDEEETEGTEGHGVSTTEK